MEMLTLCFAMCNDITIVKDEKTGKDVYNGESQEEHLLLEFCKTHNSYELKSRGNDMITLIDKRIKGDNNIREFRIVRNIKFTTVRRQQTMILYDMKNESIIAFTKGADEAIFPKARAD